MLYGFLLVLYHIVQHSCGYRPIWSENIIKCSYLTRAENVSSYHCVVSCLVWYLMIVCISAWIPVKTKIHRRMGINSTTQKVCDHSRMERVKGTFICIQNVPVSHSFHVCIQVLAFVCRLQLDIWCVWVRAQQVIFHCFTYYLVLYCVASRCVACLHMIDEIIGF